MESCIEVFVGKSIKNIGKGVFKHCTNLKYIEFNPDFEVISQESFYGTSLESYELKGITGLDKKAFMKSHLKNVSFPDVTFVSAEVFCDCIYLEEVNIPNAIAIANSCFKNCKNLCTVNLPKVASIDQFSFYGCTSLRNISLNSLVIGNSAFENSGIESLTALRCYDFGTAAFKNCYNLKTISIPAVSDFQDEIFYDCYQLKFIFFNPR